MTISIIDYNINKVQVVKNCPNEWGNNEIENFLYKTLKKSPKDIMYMDSDDINVIERYALKRIDSKN